MSIRGIRGATVAPQNEAQAVLSATRELLQAMLASNPGLVPEEIASIFFTVTPDLTAVHPALAARQLGWGSVPLLCAQEIPVPGGMERCIRILIHWNTPLTQAEVRHVYLGEAARLRPDLNPPAARQAQAPFAFQPPIPEEEVLR
jgi:chorismate mutase